MAAIGTTSGSIKSDYLTLMVTQLQNQNPLEPMSNNDMTSQLALLAQLEHLESIDNSLKKKALESAGIDEMVQLDQLANISNSFQNALLVADLKEAISMIGKIIGFIPEGQDDVVWEFVETVGIIDGEIVLKTEENDYHLDEVEMKTNLKESDSL